MRARFFYNTPDDTTDPGSGGTTPPPGDTTSPDGSDRPDADTIPKKKAE